MQKWMIGSDPEMFLSNKDGTFYSAYAEAGKGPIKGTKDKPEETAYGAIQVDGMAVELNTIPTLDIEEFNGFIEEGLADVKKRFPKQTISYKSFMNMDDKFLAEQPVAATRYGCAPTYTSIRTNGASGVLLPPKADHTAPSGRAAGGHIHIGWCTGVSPYSSQHLVQCAQAVRALDLTVGIWDALAKPAPEQARARQYFAPVGSFRPKSYGLEYRTLGNGWLFDAEHRTKIIQRIVATMDMLAAGEKFPCPIPHPHVLFTSRQGNFSYERERSTYHRAMDGGIEASLNRHMEKRYGTTG